MEDLMRNIDRGKLQPQAVELEQAVLGSMMIDPNCISEVFLILSSNSWYKEAHKEIFASAKALYDKNQPIDILTVTESLKSRGKLEDVGGPYYISQLTNHVANSKNVQFHARVVQEKYVLREIIRFGTEIVRKSFNEEADPFEIEEMITAEVVRLGANFGGADETPASEIFQEVVDQAEAASKSPDGVVGIPTGFRFFDKSTGGLHNTDLIIVAGRPGMGKTAAVLSWLLHQILHTDKHIVFFSLEMGKVQLMARLVAMCGLVDAEKLRKGGLSDDEWKNIHKAGNSLCSERVHIFDDKLTLTEIISTARRKKNQKQCDVVYVDYMQLISHSKNRGSSREQDVSEISREMKLLAKGIRIPVIALSQLNRSVESRGGDKRPMISDLRESGAIEQDADIIAFIYRAEYYNIHNYQNGESTLGIGEVITAKNRHGPTDSIKLRWLANYTLFQDLDSGRTNETERDNSDIKPSGDFEEARLPYKDDVEDFDFDESFDQ